MSSYVSGITFVATTDNMLFPFSTDFLVQTPISIILSNIIGFTIYQGVNVIKIGVSSSQLQTCMIIITGFTLTPLCYYNEPTNTPDVKCDSEESTNVSNICYKGDELDILDDDEEFSDFDTFVQNGDYNHCY